MFKVFSVLAALVAFAPGAQAAATLNFFVTLNGIEAFSWDQSAAPVPLSFQTGLDTLVAVTDTFGGSFGAVSFSAAPAGMFDVGTFSSGGPQVYSGSEAHPIFSPGSFDGTDVFGDDIFLSVTTVSQGVPEAETWVLMIIGLGGVGAAFRARRRALAQALS